MKLTLSGEVFSHGYPLEKTLVLAQSFDISFFELWAGNCPALAEDCHIRLYRNRDLAATKGAFAKAGIGVACVAFGGAFHPEIVEDSKLYSDELVRAVEWAAELSAPLVNHYLTCIAPMEPLDLPLIERYVSSALRRAEALGVTLVLENEAVDATHTPEQVLAIIDHFGSPHFKANFDATNYYQGSNEAFPYAYEMVQGAIGYVHIKNGKIFNPGQGHDEKWLGNGMTGANQGRRIVYTPPLEGAVNIWGLLHRLRADGYDGFLTLEPHSTVEEVIAYYHQAIPLLRQHGFFVPQ